MTKQEDQSLTAAMAALKKSQLTKEAAPSKADQDKAASQPQRTHPNKAQRKAQHSKLTLPGADKVTAVFDVFWNGWAKPVTRFLNPITTRIWRFYRWSYEKFAHVKTKDGNRIFSRNRAAIVTAVLAVLTLMTPIVMVRQIIPTVSRTIYDAGMLATMKEDRLFLGRAELINPDREIFQVMGCRDIKGCDGGDNTTYYRLRDNVILDIKYWTTRFEPYDPAEIAGAMVSELNDCTITYYGRRSKALGWFPYIVSASCTPV